MKSSLFTWLLILGLGATTGWTVYRNQALQDRLSDVEAQLTARPAPQVDAKGVTPALATGVIPRRIEGLQSQIAQLRDEMERVAAAGSKAVADKPMNAEGVLTDEPQFRDAVREVVLDLTNDIVFRQKLGGQVGKLDLGDDAPFVKLADTLKLDANQEEKFRGDLMVLKEDVMLMLTQERDDGVDVMARIQEAENLGEGDPKRAKLFMSLFTLKVPGTEETYWDRVVKMRGAFRKRTDQYLSDAQIETFNAIKVDLLSVNME